MERSSKTSGEYAAEAMRLRQLKSFDSYSEDAVKLKRSYGDSDGDSETAKFRKQQHKDDSEESTEEVSKFRRQRRPSYDLYREEFSKFRQNTRRPSSPLIVRERGRRFNIN